MKWLYTVGHKKRATLFGIITPMFRGGFLHFAPMETGRNTLSGNYKICNFTTIVSLHYLRKFNTHNSTFWNQLSVYFNTQRYQRQERVQVNCFQFLLGNSLNSLPAENLLHSHRFINKILSSKLNIRSIVLIHSKHSWRAMRRNYDVITDEEPLNK